MTTARGWRLAVALGLLLMAVTGGTVTRAAVSPPSPGGFADGAFCTYGKGYFSNNSDVASLIQGGLPFSIGAGVNAYTWKAVGQPPQPAVAVAALQQAVGDGGTPGAFSASATNPTDMGTGGSLAAQTLAESLNLNFSERVVTPTGFQPLSLVGMEGVKLGGVRLTSAQASALNGQAAVQVREAANVALGGGAVPYGLSFGQLTDLIALLNGSFSDSFKDANAVVQPCGAPSKFAQTHLYQPYVTSSAFAGKRPVSISLFAPKPTYDAFSGDVVFVGRGCPADSIPVAPGSPPSPEPEDPYPAGVAGKIALIERGGCRFDYKVLQAQLKGAAAAIVFNNVRTPPDSSEALVGLGGNNPVVLVPPPIFAWSGFGTTVTIPAVFVQRSTGLLLRGGTPTVTAFVQQ